MARNQSAYRRGLLIKPFGNLKFPIFVMVLTTLAGSLSWPAPRLMAQEQQPVEVQQIAGPYQVGVLMESSTLTVGAVRFIITVDDRANGEPVNGAQILISFKHQADGTESSIPAFSVPRFPGTYQAQARLVTPGFYMVSVEVKGPRGNGAVLLEPLYIRELKGFSSGSYVFIGLTLVLVAGVAYLWWSTARQNKRRASTAVPAGESTGQNQGIPEDGGPDGAQR